MYPFKEEELLKMLINLHMFFLILQLILCVEHFKNGN